jgi:SPASM domain peptide maturase of grasp-with-spasm system
MKGYLLIRPDVIATEGTHRSLVADLSRGIYFFVPNTLPAFIRRHNKQRITSIYARYPFPVKKIAKEYVNWLIAQNLALVCPDTNFAKKVVPPFNGAWDTPYPIANCILEIGKKNHRQMGKVLNELSAMRVPYLEIRIFETLPFNQILNLLKKIQESSFRQVVLLAKYTPAWELQHIEGPLQYITVLDSITIFGSPQDALGQMHKNTTPVKYIKELLTNCACGKFSPAYFYPNISFYNESRNFNSCLNRKLSIDSNGDIKNCPSMAKKYGNIKNNSLLETIAKNNFQAVWGITKNQVAVCKECEFRDICQDCRAYLQQPNDIYSKPLKCGYNPSTGQWQDWALNPLSQYAIQVYGIQNTAVIAQDLHPSC